MNIALKNEFSYRIFPFYQRNLYRLDQIAIAHLYRLYLKPPLQKGSALSLKSSLKTWRVGAAAYLWN